MEEKKLTDEVVAENAITYEEIIKALEFKASHDAKVAYLDGCACKHIRVKDILGLIHRLQDDYSNLKERYIKVLGLNEKVIAEQKAEIERLKEQFDEKVLREIVAQNCILNEKNAELQKQVDELKKPIGKFKDQTALKKAYESLEKEFTKRSQQLKALQKNNDDLVEDLSNMTIYPEEAVKRIRAQAEKDTAKEIIKWIKLNGLLQYGGYVIHDSTLEQIGKKYGVEVE